MDNDPERGLAAVDENQLAQPAAIAATTSAIYAIVAAPAMIWGTTVPVVFAAASLILAAALVALSVIDVEAYRLPDALTLPLVAAGILLCAVTEWDQIGSRILAAAAGFASFYAINAIYRRIRGRSGLGLGDAKLLAAAGAWLGLAALPEVVLVAAVSALAGAVVLAARGRRISGTTMLPFGPFLAFGFWIVWIYGFLE